MWIRKLFNSTGNFIISIRPFLTLAAVFAATATYIQGQWAYNNQSTHGGWWGAVAFVINNNLLVFIPALIILVIYTWGEYKHQKIDDADKKEIVASLRDTTNALKEVVSELRKSARKSSRRPRTWR
jgi:hypothetical protein